jgi:hypothetical protein
VFFTILTHFQAKSGQNDLIFMILGQIQVVLPNFKQNHVILLKFHTSPDACIGAWAKIMQNDWIFSKFT